MIQTLSSLLAISLVINGILFLFAYRFKSDKLTDLSYALTFISLAIVGFWQSDKTVYDAVALLMVTVWGVRIGGFLLYRVMKVGKDQRFDGIRENFFKFGKFWLSQAIAVWVLMIPITLAFNSDGVWTSVVSAGVAVWLFGFVIETVADAQKYRFTSIKSNKDKWIDTGIWRYSRHPNYFGEILVWVGIYLFAASQLDTTGQLISLVSPLFITILLLFISGIPILEKSADKRWGKIREYNEYKKRTSILIPFLKINQR